MNVTIIGTGNMARGLGERLLAGGNQVTILGKETSDADQVVSEIGDAGSARAGRSGDEIADEVVVLAVYFPDAKAAVGHYGNALSGKVLVDITNPVNEPSTVWSPRLAARPPKSWRRTPVARASSRPSTPPSRARWRRAASPTSPWTSSSPAMTRKQRPSCRSWRRTAGCAPSTSAR